MDGAFPVLRAEVSVELDADPEEAAESVSALRSEVLELDIEAVDWAAARQVPAGARGMVDGAGALVVTLSDSAVLVALVGVLRSWVSRDRGRKVTIRVGKDSIEVVNPSDRVEEQLVAAWLERHGGR
jgi:hypothetical protein